VLGFGGDASTVPDTRHLDPNTYVGMPLREAESHWPDVSYRADAPAEYAQAIEPVLELLAELSPTVEWSADPAGGTAAARHEPTARYAVFLDGTGLVGLYGSEARLGRLIVRELWERTGHRARIGIADGRYAALLAALRGDLTPPTPLSGSGEGTICIVPAGGDAQFLAPLPVLLLPLPPEARERLAALGARTLLDFSRLPANALRHRFGPEGITARMLAAGHDEGPLRPRVTPLQLHDTLELEWVETSLDRLLFLLKHLADRLSVRLGHHGLGCGRLRIIWLLDEAGLSTGDEFLEPDADPGTTPPGPPAEDGTVVSVVRLAEPAGSGASLLEHLRWHAEGMKPDRFRDPRTGQMRGVRGILVEAEELAQLGGRQLALFPGEDGRAAHPERLLAAERALARLQARWGEDAVQQAELVASRRPEHAFRWRETAIQTTLPSQPQPRARRTTKESPASVRHGKLPLARPPGRSSLPPLRAGEGGEVNSLWLTGQLEDVQVDRGGRLPDGQRRHGTVIQGGQVRRIEKAAGPWRLVERWAAEPIARDAYHVVLADGAACWLVHDRHTDRWQLLGTFD
jgi:protein ImuB